MNLCFHNIKPIFVFCRCPPIVSIIIRILQSSLAASRSQLNRHLLDRPCEGEVSNNNEREELKTALIAAQESAAIQILLEVCAETGKDKVWILFICYLNIFELNTYLEIQ